MPSESYIYHVAVKTQHRTLDYNIWFIIFTCHSWIPLFEIANSYDLVYNWLRLIDDKHGVKTAAFVIMPNHVHLLLHLTTAGIDLNKLIGNRKRFMAYAIVRRLAAGSPTGDPAGTGRDDLLIQLSSACSARERARGQKHKMFEQSFDAKPVYSLDFLHQKLDYIHHNPVRGKWSLCDDFTDYEHSSAAFYKLERRHPFVEITDYRVYW